MTGIPTREDIERLIMNNPIVHNAFAEMNHSNLSYEDMLRLCVVLLAEQNEALMSRERERLAKQTSLVWPFHV